MTYRKLKEKLQTLTEAQLDTQVTLVQNDGEVFMATLATKPPHEISDVLDSDHPVILVRNNH